MNDGLIVLKNLPGNTSLIKEKSDDYIRPITLPLVPNLTNGNLYLFILKQILFTVFGKKPLNHLAVKRPRRIPNGNEQ